MADDSCTQLDLQVTVLNLQLTVQLTSCAIGQPKDQGIVCLSLTHTHKLC